MELVIKRSKWYRGNTAQNSKLIFAADPENKEEQKFNGHKCCLGFYGKNCGLGWAEMANVATPTALARLEVLPSSMWWLVEKESDGRYKASQDGSNLMQINDSGEVSDTFRERKITEIFARHDVQVRFED